MEHPHIFLSSDEISLTDLEGLLKRAGAQMLYLNGRSGVFMYEQSRVWVSLEALEDNDKEILLQAERMVGAPIRSSVLLLISKDDWNVGFQIAYDFVYLCMQHYRGIIDDSIEQLLEDEPPFSNLHDKEWVTMVYRDRYMSKDVPPLVEKPEEETN
ncbi:hypothetical protein [Tengunoibacter tsumagoiensis]|uniref:Uncharacterized protein n=1 Tax=Tengunoibacter tsumagoiensis TaxID=2014871 RepID=A0A401ZUI3_9CHLR|nr:hypothetical protein [Tengunoibacter tsumagoiensis]GCE10533.1 hypothetical protein KTT_03920 [Tengunoibacter tsumagoiensis]